jgi:hypothetical protein
MKYLLTYLIFLILSTNCYSQADSLKKNINILGINSGYGYCRYNDPIESANVYFGGYFPLKVTWSTISNKKIDEISFSYGSADFNNNEKNIGLKTDFKAKFYNLSYKYQRFITGKNNVKFFLGAGINGYISRRNLAHYYILSWVHSTNGDIFFSANISATSIIKLKENYIHLSASNSVYTYINPAIFLAGQKDGRFIFFPKFNSFVFNTDYKVQMSKNIFFDLGYSFFYYRYPRFGNTSITKGAHNQLFAGLNYKF